LPKPTQQACQGASSTNVKLVKEGFRPSSRTPWQVGMGTGLALLKPPCELHYEELGPSQDLQFILVGGGFRPLSKHAHMFFQ